MRWLLLLAVLPAVADGSGDVVARIRRHSADILSRLPNYTCRMTIERATRASNSKKWRSIDTLRLDVAYVAGSELFAWPGAGKFEEKPLNEIVGPGALTGTGDFAMHIRAILVDPGARIACREGNPIECSYSVPLASTKYLIVLGEQRGLASYHGRFTADPVTLDLQHLDVAIDEVRPAVAVQSATKKIEYVRVPIGDSTFLLPRLTELEMETEGMLSRNTTRFDECRQYTGESVISFGDPADIAPAAAEVSHLDLPPGLRIESALETRLTLEMAIGDPVKAIVSHAVKQHRLQLLPKGARLLGRVTRLERAQHFRMEYCIVGVSFDSVECDGARGDFQGRLESVGAGLAYYVPGLNDPAAPASVWNSLRSHPEPRPGESIFYVRGSSLRVPALRMIWRTK
jgi:hypothetical protein